MAVRVILLLYAFANNARYHNADYALIVLFILRDHDPLGFLHLFSTHRIGRCLTISQKFPVSWFARRPQPVCKRHPPPPVMRCNSHNIKRWRDHRTPSHTHGRDPASFFRKFACVYQLPFVFLAFKPATATPVCIERRALRTCGRVACSNQPWNNHGRGLKVTLFISI